MSGKSKNQTAAERAAMRQVLGSYVSAHTCASSTCPHPDEHIAIGELVPVVTYAPHKKTIFYHKACAPKVTVPAR